MVLANDDDTSLAVTAGDHIGSTAAADDGANDRNCFTADDDVFGSPATAGDDNINGVVTDLLLSTENLCA